MCPILLGGIDGFEHVFDICEAACRGCSIICGARTGLVMAGHKLEKEVGARRLGQRGSVVVWRLFRRRDINTRPRNDAGRWAGGMSSRATPSLTPNMFAGRVRVAWPGWAGRALRNPQVLAVGEEHFSCSNLTYAAVRRRPDFARTAGPRSGSLHRFGGAGAIRLDHDNFIGRLPQSQRACAELARLLSQRRLEPQLRLAARRRPVQFGHDPRIRPTLRRAG